MKLEFRNFFKPMPPLYFIFAVTTSVDTLWSLAYDQSVSIRSFLSSAFMNLALWHAFFTTRNLHKKPKDAGNIVET